MQLFHHLRSILKQHHRCLNCRWPHCNWSYLPSCVSCVTSYIVQTSVTGWFSVLALSAGIRLWKLDFVIDVWKGVRGCGVTCTKCNGRHHKLFCGLPYNTSSKTSGKLAASADAQSSSGNDITAVEISPNSTSSLVAEHVMFVQSTSCYCKLPALKSGVLEVSQKPLFDLTPSQTGCM